MIQIKKYLHTVEEEKGRGRERNYVSAHRPAPRASTEKACASEAQRPTGDNSFQFSAVS